MLSLNIVLVLLLIIITAFFVATEFAIVKIRPSKLDQLIKEGNKKAINAKEVVTNLDAYLSACQLGITITSLGLGWLGEPTVERALEPVFSLIHVPESVESVISFIIAFSIVTFLHVVLGELAPKTIAIQKAEAVSLKFAGTLIIFNKVMYPFIWVLNHSANLFVNLFGYKSSNVHEDAHSEEELKIILSDSYQKGQINQSEYKYVNRIFEFDELSAHEIMVPRTDMICLYKNNDLKENMKIIKEEQYTRFPVALDNKDNIIGMINTKEFLLKYTDNPDLDINSIMRPIYSITDVTPIKSLMKEMQKERVHMAMLKDEYGGTSGLVTLEDILEEIVGEIRDEFDSEEKPEIEILNPDNVIVDGKVLIHEINNLLNLKLDTDGFETIGGWLYGHNELLNENDIWSYQDITFKVIKRDAHRIRKIEISRNIKK